MENVWRIHVSDRRVKAFHTDVSYTIVANDNRHNYDEPTLIPIYYCYTVFPHCTILDREMTSVWAFGMSFSAQNLWTYTLIYEHHK